MPKEIVFITGASSDVGLELIKELSATAKVIAHYRDKKFLNNEIASSENIISLRADLSEEKQVVNMLDQIELNYGIPDKIVHLASPKINNIRFKDMQWQDIQHEMNVSFKSIFLILNRFLPLMAKKKQGKVLFMLSSYTINIPPKAISHYVSIKYSLLGLMKALASEYCDKNLQINAVSPSMIDTKFLENLNEKLIEMTAYNHPLKRNALVEDVVPLILFLLSDKSDFINGVNIPISGGSVF